MDKDSGDINPAVQVSSDSCEREQSNSDTSLSGSPSQSHGRRLTEIKPSVSSLHCLSFHDIRYEVTQHTKCFKSLPNKVILNSISGLMLPGINAIMGPTGGGKTSLLDVLADRKSKKGLSGVVLVNGQKILPNFKTTVGYVVQDDIVMGTLTVRENLHFSAALRLPSHMTHKQRKERVEGVIRELGLMRCANTKIGTEFIRGVSGGERKRTNIGMELIIEPQVLFLDEPTTGLDAFTAVSVVQVLKDWCRLHDRILIMSIHQPRYAIFKMFDTLTLLSLGNLVYQGNSHKALEYFERIGYVCEEHENPADYFLDVINQCQNNKDTETIVDMERQSGSSEVIHHVDLVASYKQSTEYRELHNVIDPILVNQKNGVPTLRLQKLFQYLQPTYYSTNFIFQLLVLILRSGINLFRNPITSLVQIVIMIVFALIVGIVYLRLDQKEVNLQTVVSDRLGAFFFIALTQVFGNLSAVDLFIKQKALFIHENASGFYRVSAFYFSKIFTDLILLRIIPLILFSVIVYFMVGFTVDVSKFFIFFLTLALTSISAASLAFAISALVSVTAVAIVLLALSFILSMLFGGFLIALSTLPDWLQWLKFLSIFRYAIEALSINEISDQCYCMALPSNVSTIAPNNNTNPLVCFQPDATCLSGSAALSSRGYETTTAWLWYDQIGLTIISLLFLALAYINLRLVRKEK